MDDNFTLSKQIRKQGKIYKQRKRSKHVAIYDVFTTVGERKNKRLENTSCEVFAIHIRRESRVPSGEVIPTKEKFPSNEDFGHIAWSYPPNSQKAIQKFDELNNTIAKNDNRVSFRRTLKPTTKIIKLDDHVTIKQFAGKTVMVLVDKKPKGPKPHLTRALREVKNVPQYQIDKMKVKEMAEELFS